PGRCVLVEDSMITTGGAVSNTGLALNQLGVPAKLMGKIGSDAIGQSLCALLEKGAKGLSGHLIIKDDQVTSYAVVLNPPGVDRSFLYVPGANNFFSPAEVGQADMTGSRFFHLGYPSEMRLFYQDTGAACRNLLSQVRMQGLTTSVDMALPDVDSEAGRVDWKRWLHFVLPEVDMFLPSVDELFFMLLPNDFDSMESSRLNRESIEALASQTIAMGAAMVLIKLGEQGLYFQSTDQLTRLLQMGLGQPADVGAWLGQRIWCPSFKVKVAGTTGAGDCAAAGFLAGVCKGLNPKDAVTMAAAAGASGCEKADASSGVPHWEILQHRIDQGWERNDSLSKTI
ncbi:MAG: PfkB family carbohydrate kinase, partial [Saprospiraceae bacterium]|nr:PfkB family carbohydrate kinase [Saprospiraceae bacterium]